MHYLSKFALIIMLILFVAALSVTGGVNAGADDRITETAVQSAEPEYWLGYRVMRRITPDDPPDAIHRDLYGMYDTIWAYELVSAYESGEISEDELIREFWLHRPTFMATWLENHGAIDLTTDLLLNMITSQSNGIIDVIGDNPVFFDSSRYLDYEGNVVSGFEVDYEASLVANNILAQTLIRLIVEGDPYAVVLNHCCCARTGIAECLPKTDAGCNINPSKVCEGEPGNHMCTSADGC